MFKAILDSSRQAREDADRQFEKVYRLQAVLQADLKTAQFKIGQLSATVLRQQKTIVKLVNDMSKTATNEVHYIILNRWHIHF